MRSVVLDINTSRSWIFHRQQVMISVVQLTAPAPHCIIIPKIFLPSFMALVVRPEREAQWLHTVNVL